MLKYYVSIYKKRSVSKVKVSSSSSNLIWLKPSQPRIHEFRSIWARCLVEVVVVPGSNSTVNIIDRRWLILWTQLSYLQFPHVLDVEVLIRFLNRWDVGKSFLKSPVISFWNGISFFGILLVFFPNLCNFSIDLGVHSILLILNRVKRFIVGSDSVANIVSLVVAINLVYLRFFISNLWINVHRRKTLYLYTGVHSVFLLELIWGIIFHLNRLFVSSLSRKFLSYAPVHLWVLCPFLRLGKMVPWTQLHLCITYIFRESLLRRFIPFLWRNFVSFMGRNFISFLWRNFISFLWRNFVSFMCRNFITLLWRNLITFLCKNFISFFWRNFITFISSLINSFWRRVWRSHFKSLTSLCNRSTLPTFGFELSQLSDESVIRMDLNKMKNLRSFFYSLF